MAVAPGVSLSMKGRIAHLSQTRQLWRHPRRNLVTSNLVVRWEANETQAGSSSWHKIATYFFHVEKQKSRRYPPTLGQCQGLEGPWSVANLPGQIWSDWTRRKKTHGVQVMGPFWRDEKAMISYSSLGNCQEKISLHVTKWRNDSWLMKSLKGFPLEFSLFCSFFCGNVPNSHPPAWEWIRPLGTFKLLGTDLPVSLLFCGAKRWGVGTPNLTLEGPTNIVLKLQKPIKDLCLVSAQQQFLCWAAAAFYHWRELWTATWLTEHGRIQCAQGFIWYKINRLLRLKACSIDSLARSDVSTRFGCDWHFWFST